jgi:hypothetical protein
MSFPFLRSMRGFRSLYLHRQAPAQKDNRAAVIDCALRAIDAAFDTSTEWMDFSQYIREDRKASLELDQLVECGMEGEDARLAFGIGMAAGLLYAQIIAANGTPVAPEAV